MAKLHKQSGGARRPTVFHRNSSCPEYGLGETNFIVDNVFTPATKRKIQQDAARRAALAQNQSIPEVYKRSPSYFYRDQIARCMTVSETGTRYTSEVAKYVVQAVRQFGVDALQLNRFDKYRLDLNRNKMMANMAKSHAYMEAIEPSIRSAVQEKENPSNRLTSEILKKAHDAADAVSISENFPDEKKDPLEYMHPLGKAREEAELFELRFRDGLGSVICDVLRQWREQAQQGTIDERKKAVKFLRQFGEALIPDTRGKRANVLTATSYDVKKFYLRELYRLYHIENALHSEDGPRNHSLRVKEISESYGFPIDLIREFWGLDDESKPSRQPLRIKDMARELTARQFKITLHRVSNVIAS